MEPLYSGSLSSLRAIPFARENIDGHWEDPIAYTEFGFHPVHPGDVYSEGRYRVIRKISSGDYSTIWLAEDTR
jgi:hypothetical protein